MSRRTSGIDDLVETLVRQHGVDEAFARANDMRRQPLGPLRKAIWSVTAWQLHNLRSQCEFCTSVKGRTARQMITDEVVPHG